MKSVKRTHPITIDFVTKPQAAYTSGTSLTLNNPYGTTNLTGTLKVGDMLVLKESVGSVNIIGQPSVETVSQAESQIL